MAYCCRHGLLLSLTKQLTFIEITEAGNCHFSHLNAPRTNRATSKKNNKNPSTFGKDSQLAAMTTVIDKHNEIIELINQRASSSKRSAAGAVTRQFQQKTENAAFHETVTICSKKMTAFPSVLMVKWLVYYFSTVT